MMLRCNHSLLAIRGSDLLAKAIGQQHFRTNDFKAEASPFAGQELHEAVQTFSVPSSVTVGLAEDATRGRRVSLRLDVNIVFILIYIQDMKGWKSQQIQELLSLKKELPHKFSARAIFPVASDRRLLRAISCDPTYFYDCEATCWSKKHTAIPRSFTNIREMLVEWINLGEQWQRGEKIIQVLPRLRCFNDAWDALAQFKDVIDVMAEVDDQGISPKEFCHLLERCGFTDRTSRHPYANNDEE